MHQDPKLNEFFAVLRQYWAEAEGSEPTGEEGAGASDAGDGDVSVEHEDDEGDGDAVSNPGEIHEDDLEEEPEDIPATQEMVIEEEPVAPPVDPGVSPKPDDLSTPSPSTRTTSLTAMLPPPVPPKKVKQILKKDKTTPEDHAIVRQRMEQLKLLVCLSPCSKTVSVMFLPNVFYQFQVCFGHLGMLGQAFAFSSLWELRLALAKKREAKETEQEIRACSSTLFQGSLFVDYSRQ